MVVGIIGILAAIGIPLYQKQSNNALAAVQKNNAYSVQKFIDNSKALGVDVTSAQLNEEIKIKGKLLPAACFTINATNGGGGTPPPATTISSSSSVTTAWAVDIKNATGCTQLDPKYNVCIDSTGDITDVTTAASGGDCKGNAI